MKAVPGEPAFHRKLQRPRGQSDERSGQSQVDQAGIGLGRCAVAPKRDQLGHVQGERVDAVTDRNRKAAGCTLCVRGVVVLAVLEMESHAGCLRFLSGGNDIEALVAPEIKPLFGTLTAFRRTDNSFHGHLPFEGERRVIQVAWLVDAAAVERKTRRGRFSRAIKWLSGRVDGWFGRGRDKDAAHLD